MRSLYEPITVAFAALAGMQLLGGVMAADDAKKQARAEADYLNAEAGNERKQGARDLRAIQQEEDRLQSRVRAVLAAGGGGTTGGSALALLTSNASDYGIKKQQMEDDSEMRANSLETRAANTLSAGRRASNMAIFGGVTRTAGTVATGYGNGAFGTSKSSTLSSKPKAR